MARALLRCLCISLAAAASLASHALVVAADVPGASAVRIAYRAYPGCPSEAEFLAQVGARIGKASTSSEMRDAQSVVVTLTAAPRGAIGKIETSTPDGSTGSRIVRGRTCAEVVSALALFTALAIDPRAAEKSDPTGGAAANSVPTAPPTPSEPPGSAQANPSTLEANMTAPQAHVDDARPMAVDSGGAGENQDPSSVSDSAAPREKAQAQRIEDNDTTRIRLGAGGVALGSFATGSVLPNAAPGLTAFVEWSTGGFGRHRWSVQYFLGAHTPAVTFQTFGGRWDIAPWHLPLHPAVEVEPGFAAELLWVTANARAAGDITAGSASRLYVAADLFGRIRYRPVPGLLASLEAGVEAPLTRYVFHLGTAADDRGILHEVPAVGWMLGFQFGGSLL